MHTAAHLYVAQSFQACELEMISSSHAGDGPTIGDKEPDTNYPDSSADMPPTDRRSRKTERAGSRGRRPRRRVEKALSPQRTRTVKDTPLVCSQNCVSLPEPHSFAFSPRALCDVTQSTVNEMSCFLFLQLPKMISILAER